MSANNEPPADAEGKPADDKVPTQRRIFGTKRIATPASDPARPDLEEKLAHLVDSVKVLQTHITGGPPAGEGTAEPEPKQRRLKRFQRTTSDESAEPEGDIALDHEVRGDETTLNANIAWPRLTRADEAAASSRASTRKHPIVIWVLVQLTGLGLLLLGYWAGQSFSGDEEDRSGRADYLPAASSSTADPLARAGINDRALEAAGLGLRAEKAGDLKTARQTWETAVAGGVQLPGADYRLAMLDIQQGDLTNADIHLTASLAAGEMMASCYFVNAQLYAVNKRDYTGAARQLSYAVRVEPFNAKYLFCWGESLRRAGRAQAAVDAITQALDRPASSSDVELFTFKLRLAKIEAGHDDAFEAELNAHLAKAPVSGDWLLLAAARDLSRSAFPAAAGHLKDAAGVLPPEVFNLLVRDFAFQGYSTHADVAALLKIPPPPPPTRPMDPGAWPAEEADPATWPPFPPTL